MQEDKGRFFLKDVAFELALKRGGLALKRGGLALRELGKKWDANLDDALLHSMCSLFEEHAGMSY